MNADGWRHAISIAVWRSNGGDSSALDGLAQQLSEEDEANQLLHNAGFGVTGTSLLISVRNALGWIEGAHNPNDGADGL